LKGRKCGMRWAKQALGLQKNRATSEKWAPSRQRRVLERGIQLPTVNAKNSLGKRKANRKIWIRLKWSVGSSTGNDGLPE